MNKYVKEFFKRGLIFAGLGPVVLAIVYLCLEQGISDFSLSGTEVFFGIISVYLLAFVQAGVSVFNQIEHWSVAKSLFFHFVTLYVAYSLCYILNSWIPFEPMVLVIFSVIFVVAYFVTWITVYISVNAFSKKLNTKLN